MPLVIEIRKLPAGLFTFHILSFHSSYKQLKLNF